MPNRTVHPMQRSPVVPEGSEKLSCEAVGSEDAIPTCGARTRGGAPCRNYGMRNGRCRMHGGASTGARTPAGMERARTAAFVHGGRSRETMELRRLVRELRADARRVVEAV